MYCWFVYLCEIEREKEREKRQGLSLNPSCNGNGIVYVKNTNGFFLNDSLTNLLLRNNILECNKFEMKALVIYDRGGGGRVFGKFESGGV
jgi:hypothetical protein